MVEEEESRAWGDLWVAKWAARSRKQTGEERGCGWNCQPKLKQ